MLHEQMGNCPKKEQKKSLQTLKQVWRVSVKSFGHSNTAHHTPFFYMVGSALNSYETKQSQQTVIAHLFIGSASYASGSVMTVTCNFFASINVPYLHFEQ